MAAPFAHPFQPLLGFGKARPRCGFGTPCRMAQPVGVRGQLRQPGGKGDPRTKRSARAFGAMARCRRGEGAAALGKIDQALLLGAAGREPGERILPLGRAQPLQPGEQAAPVSHRP